MTTVTGVVLDSVGRPIQGSQVQIVLVTGSSSPGYAPSGEIISPAELFVAADGTWSASLVANSLITPANTYYRVVEGAAVSSIVVPAAGGPCSVGSILVTPPPTPSAPGITGVAVAAAGVVAGSRPEINFVAGSNTTVVAADNPGSGRVDVTVSSVAAGTVKSVNAVSPDGAGNVQLGTVATHPATDFDTSGSAAAAQAAAVSAAATAAAATYIPLSQRAAASGVATLDAGSKLPAAQLVAHASTHASGGVDPVVKPWQFTLDAYSAVGDLNCVVDAVTNGTTVVTSASGKFVAGDVGKTVVGKAFLSTGVTSLVTTVASYQSATQVTLAAAATTTATGLQMIWGTDDTAHIQAAISAAQAYSSPFGVAAQVVSPVAPGGLGYMVAGVLKTTDGVNAVYNSQLTIGVHSDRLPGQTLELVGPADAGVVRHWNQDYPAFTGATWFSSGVFPSQGTQATSVTNGGNPSVLGGPTGKNGYGVTGTNPVFNNVTVVLRNMSIMNTHSSSGWSYCPFNFHGMARAHLDRCSFGTAGVVQYYTGGGGSGGNTDFTTPSTFSGGASIGGLMPAAGNNASSSVKDCVWNGGYTYGPVLTEHTVCAGVNTVLYCWGGVGVAGNYGDGGTGAGSLHAIRMGQWCVESCSYHLVVWGAGAGGIGPYVTGTLDTEGTVQVRGNLNNAGSLQGLMGELRLAGSPSAPTFTFPTGLRLIKDTLVPGPAAGLTLTINVAAINTYYRPASITLSGGTVTTVKVSQLAGGASAPTMTTVYTQASGSLPSMTVRVGPGQWIEIDGTVIPSAQWTLD